MEPKPVPPAKWRFDPTIIWGHISIVFATVLSAFAAYSANQRTTDNHEFRISQLERNEQRTASALDVLSDMVRGIQRDVAVLTAAQRRQSAQNYTPSP
jgi:hypothetical protein